MLIVVIRQLPWIDWLVVVVVGSSLLQLATSNSDKAVALARSERRSGRLEESIDIVFDPRLGRGKDARYTES